MMFPQVLLASLITDALSVDALTIPVAREPLRQGVTASKPKPRPRRELPDDFDPPNFAVREPGAGPRPPPPPASRPGSTTEED